MQDDLLHIRHVSFAMGQLPQNCVRTERTGRSSWRAPEGWKSDSELQIREIEGGTHEASMHYYLEIVRKKHFSEEVA